MSNSVEQIQKPFHLSKTIMAAIDKACIDGDQRLSREEFVDFMQHLDPTWQCFKCERLFDAANAEHSRDIPFKDIVAWLDDPRRCKVGVDAHQGCAFPLVLASRDCAITMRELLPMSPKNQSPSCSSVASPMHKKSSHNRFGFESNHGLPRSMPSQSTSPSHGSVSSASHRSPMGRVSSCGSLPIGVLTLLNDRPLVEGEAVSLEIRVPKQKLQTNFRTEQLFVFVVAIDVGAMQTRMLNPNDALDSKRISTEFVCSQVLPLKCVSAKQTGELRPRPIFYFPCAPDRTPRARVALCVIMESTITGKATWENVSSIVIDVKPQGNLMEGSKSV